MDSRTSRRLEAWRPNNERSRSPGCRKGSPRAAATSPVARHSSIRTLSTSGGVTRNPPNRSIDDWLAPWLPSLPSLLHGAFVPFHSSQLFELAFVQALLWLPLADRQ